MNHAEAIYQAIPTQVKHQFKDLFVALVSQTIEGSHFSLPESEKANFLKALGQAGESNQYHAIYQAFGKIVSDL